MYSTQIGNKKIRQIDGFFYGRGDEIRTHDLFVPNEALYQAEPHPVFYCLLYQTEKMYRVKIYYFDCFMR